MTVCERRSSCAALPNRDRKLETNGPSSLSALDLVQAAASSQGPIPSSVHGSVSLSPEDAVVFKHEKHLL